MKKYHRLRHEEQSCEGENVLLDGKLVKAFLCRTQRKKKGNKFKTLPKSFDGNLASGQLQGEKEKK